MGTSSCKVAFFDYSGNLITQTSEGYFTSYSGLWAEQNPEDWWQAIKKGIKRLIVKYPIEPRDKFHFLYQELFEVYQNLYLKLREDFEHLVKIGQMAKSCFDNGVHLK